MPPQAYVPSLMVRLTDDPDVPSLESARQWKATLLSEVELLLNMKRDPGAVPEGYKLTAASIANYGLPDCTSMSVKDPQAQQDLRVAIENALRYFEPRLSNVHVSLEPVSETEASLRFTVEALARMEPNNEPVRFETVLEPDRAKFVVNRDGA